MLTIRNPADGSVIAELPEDTEQTVSARAQKARAAQPAWAAVPLNERLDCLRRFRAALVDQREQLASILTSEVGKPISQSRSEVAGVLGRIDFFLANTEATLVTRQVHDEGGTRELISHEPLGVVANISAWNYPYFVGANVFVPALLAGNAVLYKPSEFATLTGLQIARLLHAAGVPQDVFVPCSGAGTIGAALLTLDIDGVFFTGSHATGMRIAETVARRLVKLQLELGGKDPSYVRADADAKIAAQSLADGAMYNTGQSCCSVERIYVHEDLHDVFVEHFVAAVAGFKVGDPRDESTYIGAITRAPQLDVLDRQVADAKALGARLHTGGHRLPGPGNWYAPTVYTNVDHRMELMREESFGPIIGIQKVSGDDEAIALMNDTRYGLTAGVYTRDAEQAQRLLSRVKAGSVYWNCCDRVSPRLPWTGRKHSGIGSTLSTAGIRAFLQPKAWHLRAP
jgi:acyl-CoA reductase-like NAD-dependent aldehyde dehydrogenase